MGQAGNTSPRIGKKRAGGKLKKNSGHAASHAYGRAFGETTCPVCRNTMRGSKPVRVCGACGAPIPQDGYVQVSS